jgi:hypothetical protein
MRKGVPHIVALLLYGMLAVLATWPLALHMESHFPGAPGEWSQDVWQQVWNVWWVREALVVRHTNPYTTEMLFYPQGASLYLHSLNLPLGLIGMVLLPFVDIVTAYNVLTLLLLVVPAYGVFLLARHAVGPGRGTIAAALVAGSMVLCSPHRLVNMRGAQLAILSDYGVPLILLAVLIALERRTWRMAALAAGAMLLAGLSKWYHLFHAFIALAPLLLWHAAVAWREGGRTALLRDLATWGRIGGVATLLLLPFVVPAVIEALTAPYARKSDTLVYSANLFALIPQTFGGIWQQVPPVWTPPYVFALVPLLLALVGVLLAPRKAGPWAATAGVCLVLSLGPRLYLGEVDTGIPLPYAIFRALPVVDTLRAPGHLNTVTTMMLAVVAAVGMSWFFRRLPVAGNWLAAFALIVLVVVETVRLPFPLIDASVSPFFPRLADEPGEWSLLELPLDRFDRDRIEMYTQTYHEKYILTGLVSRSVPRLPYESAPPIAQMQRGSTRPDIVSLAPAERDQLLKSLRVRYLVVHLDPRRPERATQQVATARHILGPLTHIYSDAALQAYRLDEVAAWLDGPGRTTRREVPLYLGLDLRWQPPEMGGHGLLRWLPPDGGGLWTYTQRPRRVVLELSLYSLPGARPLEIWLNGEMVQTLPIIAGLTPRRYLSSPLSLPPGPNLIELRAPQEGARPRDLELGDDPRSLTFAIHRARLREVLGESRKKH